MLNISQLSQTLLLPLIGRANSNLISDIEAKRIVDIYHDELSKFFKYCSGKYSLIWQARALFFDLEIQEYLKLKTNATIVNLGAGLDTTFYRINNDKIHWVDLDLPEVINIRKNLLTQNEQINNISCSILDFDVWITQLKTTPDIFFAGGLLFYFTKQEVKKIFEIITTKFPKAIILFDSISLKQKQKTIKRLNKMNLTVSIGWTLDSITEVQELNDKYTITKLPYFYKLKYFKQASILQKYTMHINDLFNKSGFVKLTRKTAL